MLFPKYEIKSMSSRTSSLTISIKSSIIYINQVSNLNKIFGPITQAPWEVLRATNLSIHLSLFLIFNPLRSFNRGPIEDSSFLSVSPILPVILQTQFLVPILSQLTSNISRHVNKKETKQLLHLSWKSLLTTE